jgi:anaerobic magnesium-protoporphyrin IX monomethyl ester cyclase
LDILLCHSYFLNLDPVEQAVMKPYPPLGLLYISSYLKAQKFNVGVCDTTFIDYDTVAQRLAKERPRAVGIYTNLMTRAHSLAIMKMAKNNGCIVILGGPEAANYVDEYLEYGADVIVAGEGELTLAELLAHIREHGLAQLDHINGLIYRNSNGEIHTTKPRALNRDIDAFPFPDRRAIDLGRYMDIWEKYHGVRSISLITARGCPYACQWCSHSVFGISYRHRSPENVIAELLELRDVYNHTQVWYADDVFTMNYRWLNRFADLLEENGLHYPFESISREDRLTEDVVKTLKRMGCYRIWVGAESGSQRILDAMERRTNAVRMREMIKLLQKHGIRAGTFIMVGYDGETKSDLRETVKHLKLALPDDVFSTLSYPIKGTPYHQKVLDRIVLPDNWATSTERDIKIIGRHSRDYYNAAEAWIQSEVHLTRAIQGGLGGLVRSPKLLLRIYRNKFNMWRRRNELEA